MSITTIKTVDKIKLLDQMLEDIAGDEFDDFDASETSMRPSINRFAAVEELEMIDSLH